MGIDPDFEKGNDCLLCWPAGGTPKYIWAAWSKVVLCPWAAGVGIGPPPQVLKMTQTIACSWVYDDGTSRAAYGVQMPFASLRITTQGVLWFDGLGAVPCAQNFINRFGCIPLFQAGAGGFGCVRWTT